jgi:hypothetical protein
VGTSTTKPASSIPHYGSARKPFQGRDRQIDPAGAGRVRFGQKDGPKPIGDVEPRIERRRDVEERVKLVELLRLDGGQHGRRLRCKRLFVETALGPAIVLNGTDPVHIGRQGVIGP